MNIAAANAQKLLEAFREIECDLPENVYKLMINPLEELCNEAIANIGELEQNTLRREFIRLLEDNPKLFLMDKQYVKWLQSRAKSHTKAYVEHGAIQIADDAPVNTDDFLADMDDDGGGPTPDVGETMDTVPPPVMINFDTTIVRTEHRRFEPRQQFFINTLRHGAPETPTSF